MVAYTKAHDLLHCWLFEKSKFIGDNFGEVFQRTYALTKQQEIDEFDKQVTALEYDACL